MEVSIDREMQRRLVLSLRGLCCPGCGKQKAARMTFCSVCYRALPHEQRVRLYDSFGHGYEAAFETAIRTLGVRPDELAARLPSAVPDPQTA